MPRKVHFLLERIYRKNYPQVKFLCVKWFLVHPSIFTEVTSNINDTTDGVDARLGMESDGIPGLDRVTDTAMDASTSDTELTKRIEQLTGEVVAKLESWPSDSSDKEDGFKSLKSWPELPLLPGLSLDSGTQNNTEKEIGETSELAATESSVKSNDVNTSENTELNKSESDEKKEVVSSPKESEKSEKTETGPIKSGSPPSTNSTNTFRRTSHILSLPLPIIDDDSQDVGTDDDAMDISPAISPEKKASTEKETKDNVNRSPEKEEEDPLDEQVSQSESRKSQIQNQKWCTICCKSIVGFSVRIQFSFLILWLIAFSQHFT